MLDGILDLLQSPYPLVVAATAIVVGLIFLPQLRKSPKKSDQDAKDGDKPVTPPEPHSVDRGDRVQVVPKEEVSPTPPVQGASNTSNPSPTPNASVNTGGAAYFGSADFSGGSGGSNFGSNGVVNNNQDHSAHTISGGSNNAITRGDNSGNQTTHNRHANKQYEQRIDTLYGDANMGEGQRNSGSKHVHGSTKPRRQR